MKNNRVLFCLFVFMLLLFVSACQVNEPYVNPITIHSFECASDPIQQGTANLFSVTASSTVAGPLQYSYQLIQGGGSLSTSSNYNVTYTAPAVGGQFVVRVTITDSGGNIKSLDKSFWLEKHWTTIMEADRNSSEYSKYQTVCVARDGTLYVSAQIYAVSGGIWPLKVNTKRYEGSKTWTTVGKSSGRAYHADSVAGDRYPYLVYIDREVWNLTENQLEIWRCGEYLSNQQACYTNEFTGYGLPSVNRPKLALSSDNTLYLTSLFYDVKAPTGPERFRYLSVFRYNSAGTNWVCIGSNFTVEYPDAVDMVVDKQGHPVVAYQVGSANKLYVKRYTGSGWEQLGSSTIVPTEAASPSLAISPRGEIYIAYMDGALGQRLTVRKYEARQWVTVGAAGFTDGAGQYPNLLFDSQGVLYIVFQNSAVAGRISCMRYDQGSWVYVGMPAGSSYGARFLDAAIAPDGTIYAAYQPAGTRYGTAVVQLK